MPRSRSFAPTRPALPAFLLGLLVALSPAAAEADAELGDMPLDQLRQMPGVAAVEITFDGGEPNGQGLAVHGDLPKPTTLDLDSGRVRAWASDAGEERHGYLRHFPLAITDGDFLAMLDGTGDDFVAVDVFVEYHMPAWGGVQVEMRRPDGSYEIVSRQWGNSKDWKQAAIPLDEPEAVAGDAPQLRFAGANGIMALKRVRVVGYRGEGEGVRWGRLLRATDVEADTPDGIFAFPAGPAGAVVELENLAAGDRPVDWTLRVTTPGGGEEMHRSTDRATIPAGSTGKFAASFDAGGWALGPYTAAVDVAVDGERVLSLPILMGVIDNADRSLPRAGSFDAYLFGLDAANTAILKADNDLAYAWYDLLGVDILRGVPGGNEAGAGDLSRIEQNLNRMAERGMRSGFVMFPDDWRRQGEAYERDRERRKELLAEVARRFAGTAPGQVPFMELGNEPDLPFFYGRPVEDYVRAYHDAFDAIRAADPDRKTLVGIGGLCFHTEVGDRRARRIIELLDPDKVDVWTFHGHGAGVEAERAAYERQVHAVRDHARGDVEEQLAKPFLETESGYSGSTVAGMQEQARTAVEKQVYAMSVGMPSLYYFRLFMEGGTAAGYGMTARIGEGDFNQPKPSTLAYRQLVRRLRGHDFVRTLDTGLDGMEAYLFAERDGDGRGLVAFSTLPRRAGLLVDLAGGTDAHVFDMYGNATDARTLPGNVAGVDVGVDSIYLTWTGGDAEAVAVAPPLLTVAGDERPRVPAGSTTTLELDVNPPSGGSGEATLRVSPNARLPIDVSPLETAIPMSGTTGVDLAIELDAADAPLSAPTWWKVFPDADPDAFLADRTMRATLPDRLPKAGGGEVSGNHLAADDEGRVNLEALASVREKRPAIVYATIDSPADGEMLVGMTADWWSAWFVNGERVYDTLDTGNAHGSVADHAFTLPLEKGRNVIAGLVLSGSGGFDFKLVGPREVQLAKSGGTDPDRLDLEVVGPDGNVLARQAVPIELGSPVPPLGDAPAGNPVLWRDLQPVAVLGEQAVTNFHEKHPDQTRWYGGGQDLSAVAWLRDDAAGGKVHLGVRVRDDVAGEGDRVEAVIVDGSGNELHAGELPHAQDEGSLRWHHVALDRSRLAGGPFRLSLRVEDDDGQDIGVKQRLDLGDVDEPDRGESQVLEP